MKITEQVVAIDRAVVIIQNGQATPELSEFLEHLADRINLDYVGTGTPEGVVTAEVGSTYRRLDGGANTTFYVKESGTGDTGWVAK